MISQNRTPRKGHADESISTAARLSAVKTAWIILNRASGNLIHILAEQSQKLSTVQCSTEAQRCCDLIPKNTVLETSPDSWNRE